MIDLEARRAFRQAVDGELELARKVIAEARPSEAIDGDPVTALALAHHARGRAHLRHLGTPIAVGSMPVEFEVSYVGDETNVLVCGACGRELEAFGQAHPCVVGRAGPYDPGDDDGGETA